MADKNNSTNKKTQNKSAGRVSNRKRLDRLGRIVAILLIVVMVLYFGITSSMFLFS